MISPSSQPKSFSAPTMIDSNGVVRRRIRTGHMSSSSNGAANANPASSHHRRHIQQNRKPNSCSAEKSSSRLVSVTGITNLRCLACSDGNYVAHAAGSAIVVDPECQNEPPTFILNSSKRNITSLCCSADGRFLATGESGHNPKVRIFDLNSKSQIKELQGHRYSIDCVRISTSNPHIVVSVGNIHDTSINVWNWKTRTKLASNNICAEVYNLQFSEDNSYFVTVGVRHVKFWYLPMLVAAPSSSSAQPRSQSAIRSITLKGRSAILGEHKQNVFRDVLCFSAPPNDPRVLVLTQSGLLIELDTEDRLVMRWVDVTTTQANCMVRTCDSCIVVGCANGLGRIFDSDLSFLANIPLPSTKFGVPLGTHPSITALAFDSAQRRLHAIYDDHSQVQWEDFGCHLPRKREKTSHCSMVWALDTLAAAGESENLITGSSDGTIRLWSLVDSGGNLKCLRTLVPDETPHEHPAAIRSICVCRSIGHVAIGDAAGNISVYQNAGHSGGLAKIAILEAHENDVLSLAYSHRFEAKDRVILASSGRDRVIHLLDASSGHYEPLGSISDHSGSIQTVHLVNYPQHFNEYLLISSGADKAIVVRKCVFEPTPDDELKITRLYQLCERHSLTDLVIDRLTNQFLAAYQDRFVRIYSLNPSLNRTTCQLQFKGCTCSEGGLVKMRLLESPNQPGQSVLATACSRKRVYLWKWNPSSPPINLITIIAGAHSDPITDMRFVGSGQFLVTCSADSCLMVWQVPVFDRSTTQNATRQLNQSMKQSPKRRRWAQLDHPPVLATANESSMFDDHHDKQSTFLNAEKSPEDDRISSTTWTRADENVPPLSLQLKSYINDLLADYKSNPTPDATDALIWARNTLSSTIGFSDQSTEVSRSELVQKLCHLRSQNIDLYRNAETMINAILAPLLSMADNAKDLERSSDL